MLQADGTTSELHCPRCGAMVAAIVKPKHTHPELYCAIHNYYSILEQARRLAAEYHAALQTVERRGREVADILHTIECPHPTPERVEAVDKHYGTYPCEQKPGFPSHAKTN